jgi:hypothetical protein
MHPMVTVDDFSLSTDLRLEKMFPDVRHMPNCIANHVLNRPGACDPLFMRQIIAI